MIFENVGKRGRVLKCLTVVVEAEAQDTYLREGVENVWLIMRRDGKKKFEE